MENILDRIFYTKEPLVYVSGVLYICVWVSHERVCHLGAVWVGGPCMCACALLCVWEPESLKANNPAYITLCDSLGHIESSSRGYYNKNLTLGYHKQI